MTTHRRFSRPKSVRDYGYSEGRPIEEPGTPSGYLLPWVALDDEAEATVAHRPPQFVVIGEWEQDGIRHPDLAVSDAYMQWAGSERIGGRWQRRELA